MPRELRIGATVALPDDAFEAADLMHKVKPLVDALRKGLEAVTPGADVESAVVAARPRKPGPAPLLADPNDGPDGLPRSIPTLKVA